LCVSAVTTTTRYSPYSPSSLSPDALSDYRKKRDKNNIASKRSRQKRAEKQREMRNEKEMLERRNIELKTLLGSLEVQLVYTIFSTIKVENFFSNDNRSVLKF
uniref:BZIP domain-containing protein n=1 Tax=Angiostrongylus costaricensis TaxID=334426 RepID=A0A0R3PUJ4_ANGCS